LSNLDRQYVVDVGMGPPTHRIPLPLDGTSCTDEISVEWRVVASERPDVAYRTEYRESDETEWTLHYVFDDTPRPLHYFEATNDYLQSVPESPFTGAPAVTLSTETGYRKLSGDPFVEIDGADRCERTITDDAWHDFLEQKFGLRYRSG
jgi:arylamine N-acetyltransferase